MRTKFRAGLATTVAGLALLSASASWAETLADAIALAYASNPTLQQQRARLRSLDENYVQARQGLRPQADAQVSASYSRQNGGAESGGFFTPGDTEGNAAAGALSLSQPLYTGGRATNAIRAVEADILAGREQLRQVEQSVLLTVIQAYADVVRDTESLRIREENVGVLGRQLEEAQARFDVGEITRTDVAQSEARRAAAQALLAQSQALLAISRSNYAAVVGQNPGTLDALPALPGVPATVDEAFDVGQDLNPALRSAEFAERASRSRVAQARADLRPSVSANVRYTADGETVVPFDRRDLDQTLTGSVVLTQPLYAGGVRRSRIRQQQEENNADLIAIEGQRRDVLRLVSTAWNQLLAARASTTANEEQVRAARIAAEGVREESSVGLRTTLDVLNAELELRNAQLAVAQARRDDYVAQANLLTAMGRLNAQALVPGVETYDPAVNFQRVKGKGSVPWEPAIETLDALGAPNPKPAPAVIGSTRNETIAARSGAAPAAGQTIATAR
jgi:outer membrane protein